MAGPPSMRLVQTALRCYPERWRSRHGEEAAELARLLMRDGMPARSVAWSYFRGAASTRLVLRHLRLSQEGWPSGQRERHGRQRRLNWVAMAC